jgi:hypothetical protein
MSHRFLNAQTWQLIYHAYNIIITIIISFYSSVQYRARVKVRHLVE